MLRAALITLLLAASPAAAQTVQDEILSQLQDQGYSEITVSRTLLGRTRIVATSTTHRREIVFIPSSGVILRDYWTVLGERRAPRADHSEDGRPILDSGDNGGDDDNGDDAATGGDDGHDDGHEDDHEDEKDDGGDEHDDQEDH